MNDKKETRWIQLSDLHMFECTDVDLQKKALYKQFGAVTDFIVVTGDLHQYGKDYKQTIEFLEEINEKFNKIDKEDIIIVPGNHDASLTDKRQKAIKEIGAEIENDSDVYKGKLKNLYGGFNKYRQFLKTFYGDCCKRESLKDNVHIWKNKLAILCINTALVSDKEHFKPQIVDINGLSKLENPQLPCIAIMHHDYYGISDMHKPYVNGVFRALKVSAVLSGHKHRVGSTVIDIGNGEIIPNFCCAKSVSQPGDLWSDVGVIEYRWNEKKNEIRVIPYIWDKTNLKYLPTPKFENTDEFVVDNEGRVEFRQSFILKKDDGTISTVPTSESNENCQKIFDANDLNEILECIENNDNESNKDIMQYLKLPEFDEIYKFFSIKKICELQNGQKQILDEIKNIENVRKDSDEEKIELINEINMKEFNSALEDIETGDYAQAIDKFKKVNCWTDNRHIKFLSYFNIGFCYAQLRVEDRCEKALTWFKKAEKICDYKTDDVILLFRNIALTYINMADQENKIANCKEANKYFGKLIRNAKETETLYCCDALIHIARNFMDMCDEIPMEDVREHLAIAETIMSFICYCECELTAEMMYILVHNMARLFYFKAEKIDFKYMKNAQELYEFVLTMDYVKQNKEVLAMSNINAGLSYQNDVDHPVENIKKAIVFYEIGINLYESKSVEQYKNEIVNAKLDIATAYKSLYFYSEKIEDFKQSLNKINEIIIQEKYNPNNSLLLRTYMAQLYLYITALKIGEDPSGYIDLDNVCGKLDIMSKQIGYEKYKYTYQVLKCELELLLGRNEDCEKISSIKELLLSIQKEVYEGNKNIYLVIEQMFEEYRSVFGEKN